MFQRIAQLAAEGLRYSADLILPPVCVSCSALITRHNLLCPRCWSGMNLITPPFCERLGIPLPAYEGAETHISMQALANPPVFSRARAAAHYSGIMRRLIVRFKFEDKHEPLPLFIKLMREAGRELLAAAPLALPAAPIQPGGAARPGAQPRHGRSGRGHGLAAHAAHGRSGRVDT